ncbi:MAG TPA: isochorismate synthase [Solirubrobacteraceae bacterium]|nr:isochorismate synthase [Solirubrobacteraceae bacterium]
MGARSLVRLERRVEEALGRARRIGAPVLASVTDLIGDVDPVAVASASCQEGEDWFSFEQPDRAGYAVAGLGCVRALRAEGEDRFASVSKQWRSLTASALADQVQAPLGSGLIAFGGFAFAPHGGRAPEWDGFAPAGLVVPAVSLARAGHQTALTLNVEVAPDDTPEDILGGVRARAVELGERPLPLFDPSPVGVYSPRSSMPPVHYEQAVRAAVERIRAGELEKIVLAREVHVSGPVDYDSAAILGALRAEFPSCFVFAVRRGGGTFLAASPELLVRREGQRASTVALAGSTGRSADPAVDDHLGERLLRSAKDRQENAIVARAIARVLEPQAVWVTTAPEPMVVKVANIQHLATPIRAQLSRPVPVLELAGILHPTPAVGGEPRERATDLIPALEGLDRGWYAGAVGWTDVTGDGEFCVALRCALLRGQSARVYAGCGIVRDSDPAAELAETEIKLGALLPLLTG